MIIPKAIRDALGLRKGSRIVIEQRGDGEIVIRPVKDTDAFVDRFLDIPGKKLRRRVDLKRLNQEEISERHSR